MVLTSDTQKHECVGLEVAMARLNDSENGLVCRLHWHQFSLNVCNTSESLKHEFDMDV